MTHTEESIILSSTGVFLTDVSDTAYLVEKGSVYVYIVPLEKGGDQGPRKFLCEVNENGMVPAFVYRDGNYRHWRFLLQAKSGEAAIQPKAGWITEVLKQKFIARTEIENFEKEGFDNSLVDFYYKSDVKGKASIHNSEQKKTVTAKNTNQVVIDALQSDGPTAKSGSSAFQVLSYLCNRMNYHFPDEESLVTRCHDKLDVADFAQAGGLICRDVVLEKDWWRSDCGPLVGEIEKELVACYPSKFGGYDIYRTTDNKVEKLTFNVAQQISPKAYSIQRTLPKHALRKNEVIQFCLNSIQYRDLVPIAVFALVCALIGVLLPTLNKMIYDDYIPLGNFGSLIQICLVMLSFMIGNMAFSVVKNLFDFRLTSRIGNDLQNAAYYRLFHLPENFFREFDSADLASRVSKIYSSVSSISNATIVTGISSLAVIAYVIKMARYSGKMTWIALAMYFVYVLMITWFSVLSQKGETRINEFAAQAESKLFQYLNGVDKIRMAGVENNALLSFMRPYASKQSEEIKVDRLISGKQAISGVISSVFSMVLYWVIVKKKIGLSVGAFMAFNTAFGAFTSSLNTLVNDLLKILQEKNTIDRYWPVFATEQEDSSAKETPPELSGSISIEKVSFSYKKNQKSVLNNISISINPGEYVGIVGPSGCGKSTLLKLILGFERPNSGAILLDGRDLNSLDKQEYRRQLGVVLQNGKLISGSIYENITITAPHSNLQQVNDVIAKVGLADDIKNMPMGIHTMLGENSSTISGGQQQRILIARAIVSAPKIMIFDEATSALDNLTQKTVCDSLDKMNITRIVVAHRLSTIKNCDRIIVLDDGEIKEEGNYESLMAKRGFFWKLATRQIAE